MNFFRFFLSLLVLSLAIQGKPLVISSVYPIYDFVSIIAQNEVKQIMLISPNIDPHSFEPTPRDIVNLTQSDLFLYVSPELETWAKKFAQKTKNAVFIADIHECDERHDPHIWLDPENVFEIIEKIRTNLTKILPEKKDLFDKNAQKLIFEIKNLDEKYKNIFEKCEYKKVFFAGHNSFTEFALRYGLTFVPLTESFSSTSEPSARQLAKIIDEIKKSGVKYIYFDALGSTSIAKTIAKETKTEILPLYSIHTASKDDFAKKIPYTEYMKRNYENLVRGLMCPQQ
jgi:zinc transport system substrate-binding protein